LQTNIGISERRQLARKEMLAGDFEHTRQERLVGHVESPDLAIDHGAAVKRRLGQSIRDASVFETGVLHGFAKAYIRRDLARPHG
jgi:hypothetical protein